MKLAKPLLIIIVLSTLFACKYDVRKNLKTEVVPDYIKVSKIVDSDWVAASNWVAKFDAAISVFKNKHL
ncbi:hypothetical protein [Lacinutrix sp. MEBiC02595]